jgi:hypothetical protein
MNLGQLSTDDVSIVRGKEDERGGAVSLSDNNCSCRCRCRSTEIEKRVGAKKDPCSYAAMQPQYCTLGLAH